jgi:hypothetical protein
MSTFTSNPASSRNPVAKAYVTVDLNDYFDFSGPVPRGKSGVVKVSITGVSQSGGISGEKMSLVVKPANYDAACNDQDELFNLDGGTATLGSYGTTPYTHTTNINYGQFGDSARVNPDGTVHLCCVELTLPDATAVPPSSPVTLTVTATITFTEVSPYAALGGASSRTVSLSLGDGQPADVGYIPLGNTAIADGYAAVQITGVTSTVTPRDCDCSPGCACSPAPVVTVALPGGRPLLQTAVPKGTGVSKGVKWTGWVFAINNSKLDASAGRMNRSDAGSSTLESLLANLGLQRSPADRGRGAVSAGVNYDIKWGAV